MFNKYWSKFDQENIMLHYLAVDWENLIKTNIENVDQFFVNFLIKFNSILGIHAPLKNLSKEKLKLINKQWIALGLQNSISVKSNLLAKYLKLKGLSLKNEAQIKHNHRRNILSILLKESKKSYIKTYFQLKIYDLKSTWKGIKNLISLKESPVIAHYLLLLVIIIYN